MLIKNTYQSIKGRGVKACKRDVNGFISKNTDKDLWILKIDINKFIILGKTELRSLHSSLYPIF